MKAYRGKSKSEAYHEAKGIVKPISHYLAC